MASICYNTLYLENYSVQDLIDQEVIIKVKKNDDEYYIFNLHKLFPRTFKEEFKVIEETDEEWNIISDTFEKYKTQETCKKTVWTHGLDRLKISEEDLNDPEGEIIFETLRKPPIWIARKLAKLFPDMVWTLSYENFDDMIEGAIYIDEWKVEKEAY